MKKFFVLCLLLLQPNLLSAQTSGEPLQSGGQRMQLLSPSFTDNELIPENFTCQGEDVNPALFFVDIPSDTQSLALTVEDPDAPTGLFTHWILFNIPPETKQIPQKSAPGLEGTNDFGQKEYSGPCPPSGQHRYIFKAYALNRMLDSKEGVTKIEFEEMIKDRIIDEAQLTGLYQKIYEQTTTSETPSNGSK